MSLIIDNNELQLQQLQQLQQLVSLNSNLNIAQTNQNKTKQSVLVDVVLGAQLGDEGKGRLIDILSPDYDIVARCNSGGNAGHKVIVDEFEYAFHLVPSGILNPNIIGIIGNGCVINLSDLKDEIETIQNTNPNNSSTINITKRLLISDRAHIVLNLHKEADSKRENIKNNNPTPSAIGTTKQGMGPVYATKALRVGLRMCDLFLEYNILRNKVSNLIDELNLCLDVDSVGLGVDGASGVGIVSGVDIHNVKLCKKEQQLQYQMNYLQQYIEFYRSMVIDTIIFMNNAVKKNKKILVEGAQACLLDVDFGVYPYCTATNCTAGSICIGLGIPPENVGTINYVMKTYCTRVGNGPFPTEQLNIIGEKLQRIGHEYGTTTGRMRRCGWLDIPMIKWAITINGSRNAQICITKLDVLDTFDEIKIATKYLKILTRNGGGDGSYGGGNDDTLCELEGFPASLEMLERVRVVYETFKGWNTPTTHIRNYDDLPINAQIYLSKIQQLIQVKIKWIGVGADRHSMAIKK